MGLVQTAYFCIVTFSTIGYGDIVPIDPLSRITITVLLILNITVMSNFLSKFTDLLFLISNYDKRYDYSDHIVIIGDY